jgi:hypothetical protein
LLHRLADDRFHSIELRRRRRNVAVAEHHATNLRRADVGREVDPDTLLLETREVLAQVAPIRRDLEVLIRDTIGRDDLVVERRDGSAFAGDLGRDSLKNLRRQVRVDENPGATTIPLASMRRLAAAPERCPMAATRPSRMPRSAPYQGDPVPSTM